MGRKDKQDPPGWQPKRKDKQDPDVTALATALDALDEVHGAVVALALAAGIEHAPERDELVSPAGDRLPMGVFVLGRSLGPPPERGGMAMGMRLRLTLDVDDAEVLAFELLSAVREAGAADRDEVEIGLDGTLCLSRNATPDLRHALREID